MADPNMEAFEHWCDILNKDERERNAALKEAACLVERMAEESDHPRIVGSIVFRTNCQRIAKAIRKLMRDEDGSMINPKYGNAGDIEQTMARHDREAAGAAVWVMNRCVCCEGELQVGDAVELRANGRAAHAACTIAEELRAGGGEI